MREIFISAATATVVSKICCNMSAKLTFITIDKYVSDMIDLAKDLLWEEHCKKLLGHKRQEPEPEAEER